MSATVLIELKGEPKGKGRPRFVRSTGRAYTPARTVSYENELAMAARNVVGNLPPLECAVDVWVGAYFPIPKSFTKAKQLEAKLGELRPTKKPDVDNIAKMLDALNGIVWRDDSQVVRFECEKFYSDSPRLIVEVRER